SDGSALRVRRAAEREGSARRRRARPLTRHVLIHRRSEEKAEALYPKRGRSGKMSIRTNRHQREPAASARKTGRTCGDVVRPTPRPRGDVVGQPLVVRVVSRAAEEGAA